MYKTKGAVPARGGGGGSILSALKATEMLDSRSNLPAGTDPRSPELGEGELTSHGQKSS